MPNNIDMIALSFVRKGSDLVNVREVLGSHAKHIQLMSKVWFSHCHNISLFDNSAEGCFVWFLGALYTRTCRMHLVVQEHCMIVDTCSQKYRITCILQSLACADCRRNLDWLYNISKPD